MALILLVVLAVILGNTAPFVQSLTIPWSSANANRQRIALPGTEEGAQSGHTDDIPVSEYTQPSQSLAPVESNSQPLLIRAAVPHTIIPERSRDEITRYTVQSGDTIFGIAAQFGIAPETIMWANGRLEDNPDLLRVGQELTILPVDGVYHQAGESDTIETIATTYEVERAAIINYPLNELEVDNPQISAGQWLVVPGGTKPFVPRRVLAYSGPIPEDASKGTGVFSWPTSGQITQGFWDLHRGIDIGAWKGAPILAADSGYVVAAGWDDSGYGRMVVIDHGNGFQTVYAHLQVYFIEAGDSVAKGEQIAEMGSTGNSTGPHLHFEVRQNGVQRNPFGFLP
jgi:murein DD-endopeptidase MepM/ murein hydrolase activator NlpD